MHLQSLSNNLVAFIHGILNILNNRLVILDDNYFMLRSGLLRDNIFVKQGDWCHSANNNWSTARNVIMVVKAVGQAELSITFAKIAESTPKHTIIIQPKFVLLVTFKLFSSVMF